MHIDVRSTAADPFENNILLACYLDILWEIDQKTLNIEAKLIEHRGRDGPGELLREVWEPFWLPGPPRTEKKGKSGFVAHPGHSKGTIVWRF